MTKIIRLHLTNSTQIVSYNSESNVCTNVSNLMAFVAGKRKRLAQTMAEKQLLMCITGLVKKFRLLPGSDEPLACSGYKAICRIGKGSPTVSSINEKEMIF